MAGLVLTAGALACIFGLAAALALLWRRLKAAERTIAALRAENAQLQARVRARLAPASRAGAPRRSLEPVARPAAPADDPFDPAWTLTPAPRSAPRPPGGSLEAEEGEAPLGPLFDDVWRSAPAPRRPAPPWRLIAGAAALAAPAAAFALPGALHGVALWVAAAAILALAGLSRLNSARALGWLAAFGAAVWPLAWLRLDGALAAAAGPMACAAVGALALLFARGGATTPIAATGLVALCWTFAAFAAAPGAATASGAGFALAAMAFAVAGAVRLRAEPHHVAAWLLGCAALAALGGDLGAAAVLMAPAAALFAALFAALAILNWPHRGRRGGVLAATGALAPLVAAGAMHMAGQWALVHPLAPAVGYLAAAACAGGALAAAAQRHGLAGLGWTAWPAQLAAAAALALAWLSVSPLAFTAPMLGALAASCLALNRRAPHTGWPLTAGALAAASAALALHAGSLIPETTGQDALQLALFGLGGAAATAFACAWLSPRGGPAAAAYEVLSLTLGAAAALASIRWVATGGVPGERFVGFAEAGAASAALIGLAALLAARSAERPMRARLGDACAALGGLVFVLGPAAALNPWWGATPAAVRGPPPLDTLGLGYALPAVTAALAAMVFTQRGQIARARFAGGLAAAAAALWAALQVRHIARGPDISVALAPLESAALSALMLAGAAALMRRARTPLRDALAGGLALAVAIKSAAGDLGPAATPVNALALVAGVCALGLLAQPWLRRLAL
ncbi:MAG: hypothetical protein NW203_05665 [Hyphomonadaceae bacterium]|nr:hypothetical protein [Hyphomonadaceae bacterium]